jgi:hypothetical protein
MAFTELVQGDQLVTKTMPDVSELREFGEIPSALQFLDGGKGTKRLNVTALRDAVLYGRRAPFINCCWSAVISHRIPTTAGWIYTSHPLYFAVAAIYPCEDRTYLPATK